MWKNLGLLLICCILAVFLVREIGYVLHYLSMGHSYISHLLSKVFAGGTIGRIIRDTAALFLIPVIVALIPTGIYWAFTRKYFKYFPHVLWACWIVLTATIALH